MDPLSLTASLLAILGAGGAVAKGLDKIRRLKDTPSVLLQLNNEIADLHLLIHAVDEIFHEHTDSIKSSQHQIIYSILCRAKEALLELEELISYRWTKETDQGLEINRTAWVRAQTKVTEMTGKIRNVRTNLNGAWTVISARDESHRVELKLQQILLNTDYLRGGHSENYSMLNQTVSEISIQRQLLHALQRNPEGLENSTPSDMNQGGSQSVSSEISSPNTASTSSPLPQSLGNSNIVHFQMARYRRCKQYCTCLCHRQSFVKCPYALKRVIGSLFIGYTALPMITGPCDEAGCRGRLHVDFQVLYAFPSWLIKGAIHVTVEFTKSRGPELILRYLRVRPIGSQFFQPVLQRESDHSMSLIAAGLGSVLDVDEYGNSSVTLVLSRLLRNLTHSSITRSILETLTNLIREGADIFLENDFLEYNVHYQGNDRDLLMCDRTPYLLTWRCHLTSPSDIPRWRIIDQILDTANPSEILGFGELHSSIAGPRASCSAFENQLQKTSRQMIDSTDRTGRTALSWAVELGDLEITDKLLAKGADPNIADNAGCIPLFYYRRGYTKMSRLLATTADLDLLETLWSYGANLNLRDNEIQSTPLHLAIAYEKPQATLWLLQKRADIEALDHEGTTPLLNVIWTDDSSSMVLDSLLGLSANYKVLDKYGEGVLHCVARYASFGTMTALQQAGLSGLNAKLIGNRGYDRYSVHSKGKSALEIAERRRDNNEEWAIENLQPPDSDPEAWFTAFMGLVDSIEASDVAEQFGDFWGSLNGVQDSPGQDVDGVGDGEGIGSESDRLLGLPGAYPNE